MALITSDLARGRFGKATPADFARAAELHANAGPRCGGHFFSPVYFLYYHSGHTQYRSQNELRTLSSHTRFDLKMTTPSNPNPMTHAASVRLSSSVMARITSLPGQGRPSEETDHRRAFEGARLRG